jgi:sporulation integral membrane protein YtvI
MAHKNFLHFALYGILAILIFCFCFKYVLPVALPFLTSFFIAASVSGVAERFSERTGIKKRYASLFLGLLFFAAVGFFAFLCISKLWGELASLAGGALAASEDIMGFTDELLRRAESIILRFFPAAEGGAEILRAKIELFAEDAVRSVISAVSTRLPAFMAAVFSEVPKMLFSLGTALISCIYFCLDYELICRSAKSFLSRAEMPWLAKIPRTSFLTIAKYLRAAFILFLLTAALLAVGFLVLDVKYAWILALATAFIDALPVFGSGILLLPYAAYLLLSGNIQRGIGIILLWGAVTLLRRLAEPRIMGKSLGVHPLLNIVSVYVGGSLFGVTGIIFLPIAVVILKNLLSQEERRKA